jgi:hypothetical protein
MNVRALARKGKRVTAKDQLTREEGKRRAQPDNLYENFMPHGTPARRLGWMQRANLSYRILNLFAKLRNILLRRFVYNSAAEFRLSSYLAQLN